jgi:hypothetical protein
MQGLTSFLGNKDVHDTVLITMLITAFLAALPKPGTVWVKVTGWRDAALHFVGVAYKFAYDWATGFWSMKTGQPIHPDDLNPQQPAGPAQPRK